MTVAPDVAFAVPGDDLRAYRASLGTLYGRRLGLIGFGGIGQEVASRALAFGMSVAAVRRHPGPSPMAGVDMDELETVIREADHLVLAAPETAETHHVIRADTLALVKPGAWRRTSR